MINYNLANQEVAIRLIAAAVFGGLIGLDRQRKEGVAGLRTHMLVCVGSALIMIVSAFGFSDIMGKPSVVLDPSRMAAQVISGIGFLGAGTILFLRPQVITGLTTAAGLWAVAGIGLAIGGGLYFPAFIATLIILIILAILKPFEKRFFKSTKGKTMTLSYNSKLISLGQIESIFIKYELVANEIFIHTNKDDAADELKVTFDYNSAPSKILSALDEFKTTEGINEINSHI